jgi:hypothetical protein
LLRSCLSRVQKPPIFVVRLPIVDALAYRF